MKHYLTVFLRHLSGALEIFIALMLSAGIILLCTRIGASLQNIPDLEVWPNYDDLLENCFNLIIGVELIRMMYIHKPNIVFEVLLFAIARQIIIDHHSALSSLIGVCAIAILFATRKYLFCEFDVSDEIILRATMRAKSVNKLLGIHIPYEADSDTLADVFVQKCQEYDIDLGEDASIYFSDFGLRLAKMNGDKITRIEIIRSIH